MPEETVSRGDNTHYQGWEIEGLLTATPGPVTDFDYIIEDLIDLGTRFEVREIAYDPWKATPLIKAMENRGVTVPIVEVRQSVGVMSPAMVEFEGLVLGQKLHHNADPILDWMVANVVAKRDEKDLLKPIKAGPEKKIDGVTATLMAIDRAGRSDSPPDFEDRGLWST